MSPGHSSPLFKSSYYMITKNWTKTWQVGMSSLCDITKGFPELPGASDAEDELYPTSEEFIDWPVEKKVNSFQFRCTLLFYTGSGISSVFA